MMQPEPDISLVRKWDEAQRATFPFDGPFISRFSNDQTTLCYIASKHEGDINSPTLRTVKYAFDNFRPDVVVVDHVELGHDFVASFVLGKVRDEILIGFPGLLQIARIVRPPCRSTA